VDAAPDGVAILAVDEESGDLVQHYFDSRGVVRQYSASSAPTGTRSRAPGKARGRLLELGTI
jgi:hypothetical protein